MGNQPYEVNPSGRERTGGNRPPTIANLPAVPMPVAGAPRPATGSHQCPNCGAWTPIGSSICAECGVRIQPKPQKIRCRLCGANAPATLVICPHCGRELQPAPSRILSWGAPVVLIVLALLILAPRWESGNPFRLVQSAFGAGRAWVNEMAQQLDPQITISTLPATVAEGQVIDNSAVLATDNPVNPLAGNGDSNNTSDQAPTPTASLPANQDANQGAPPAEAVIVTPTATLVEPTATVPVVVQPTATTAPQATATATTAPATPTSLADVTVTPRQPSSSAIVNALPVVTTPDSTLIAAGVTTNSVGTVGAILQPTPTLPLPTPTPVPPVATATPAAVTYTIKAGDTPAEIAGRFGITVNELLAANGLSLNDARRLRVGQVLTIGTAAPAPTPTSTADRATATPTLPAAPTATSTPASTVRVDAPVLRSPENGSFLSCNSSNSLIWLPVAYVRESDQYLLHLGFLAGYNGDGSEQVTWVLEQWRPANVTLWDLDNGLCSLAPQAYGREWRWYVEVVEAAGSGWQPVSPPSAIGRFSWN